MLELLAKIATGEVDLARALELEPAVLGQLVERARGLLASGRRAEGIALLESLVELNNRSAALPFLLAAALAEDGEHGRATEVYALALVRAERNGDVMTAQNIRFSRARSFLALGDSSSMRSDFQAAAQGPDPEIRKVAELISRRWQS